MRGSSEKPLFPTLTQLLSSCGCFTARKQTKEKSTITEADEIKQHVAIQTATVNGDDGHCALNGVSNCFNYVQRYRMLDDNFQGSRIRMPSNDFHSHQSVGANSESSLHWQVEKISSRGSLEYSSSLAKPMEEHGWPQMDLSNNLKLVKGTKPTESQADSS